MTIKTIEDAAREIRRVSDELDKLRSLNLDLNGRRVVNASPAKDKNDYTTYQQVLDLLGSDSQKLKTESGILQVDITVSFPEVGTDVAIRPVVFLPFNEKAIPILCGARLRTAPGDGSFTLRWNHYSKYNDNTVDLFNSVLLTIPQGEVYSKITKFYPNRNIATQDYFTLDIVSTGATIEEDLEDANRATGLYTFLAMEVR